MTTTATTETVVEESPPGLGHNQPPSPFDARAERTAELVTTADVWIRTCDEITSEEQAGRAGDLLAIVREAHKKNEASRAEEARPLRSQIDEISSRYKALAARLDKANGALKGLLQPWLLSKEAERLAQAKIEREEADRAYKVAEEKRIRAQTIQEQVEADEAVAAAALKASQAAATARDRVGVRGEVSPRATGLRGAWKASEITDLDMAITRYKDHADVHALLLKLASAEARGGRRRIGGFKIERTTSVA